MNVTGIQSTYIATRDMDAACRFYAQALGLAMKFRDGSRWAQFDVGGANFALSSVAEAAEGAQGAVPVFEAGDLPALAQRVREAGGTALGLRDMGSHGSVATFADPEGHRFQIFARAKTSQPAQA